MGTNWLGEDPVVVVRVEVRPEIKENVRTLGNQPVKAPQAVATQMPSYTGHHQVA